MLSYLVSRRRIKINIRMTINAQTSDVDTCTHQQAMQPPSIRSVNRLPTASAPVGLFLNPLNFSGTYETLERFGLTLPSAVAEKKTRRGNGCRDARTS